MNDVKEFISKYRGAIIGIIIAIICLIFNLHKVLIAVLVVVAGGLLGNYVQHNKELVKEKLKTFIDKL